MSEVCRHIQNQLAEAGQGPLVSDPATRDHIESCDACTSFLKRLDELDEALADLPVHDAPDALVEKLLAMKELEEPVAAPPRRSSRPSLWRLSAGAAAAGVLLAVLLTRVTVQQPSLDRESGPIGVARLPSEVAGDDEVVASEERFYDAIPEDPRLDPDTVRELEGLGYIQGGSGGAVAPPPAASPPPPPPSPPPGRQARQSRARPEAQVPEPGNAYRRLALEPQSKSELGESEVLEKEPRPYGDEQLRKDDAGTFALERLLEDKKQKEGFELSTDAFANARVGGRDQNRGLSSLVFQDASGYWSNTYVPGDPMLRFLHARLRELGGAAAVEAPHDSVRRVSQPFDAPERNALAVFLAADRGAVTERTRLTLQVGLKATARQASRRPAMNVAVVLDRTGGTASDHALVALVRALEDASELGDTIRYVVAGPSLPELEVATTDFGTLPEALAGAITLVAGSEDSSTVLGANLVILVTGRTLGEETDRLEMLAHRSAVGGIPVSAIALGSGTDTAEIERLALAGQGSRRLLAEPSDAASIVDAELTAASRVVARAVRLRIRLMPGVELVDVLGSRRLDTVEADRVREAEQAIDQRLARNLGIAADRGEDEEGIQIVIPGFYADDSHVILLDVVASGSGPLADVTARYKDVGSLTNAVSRASFTLERGELEPTALEANVTKNVLAFRLAEGLEAAGESLARRDADGAIAILTSARQSLAQALGERPQLDAPDVRADIDLLDAYLTLIGTGVTGNPTVAEYVSASLRFASRLKLTSRVALD